MTPTRMVILAGMVLGVPQGEAQTADYYWDANGNSSGTGGTGIWTTANTWRLTSPTGTLGTWPNGNNAIFQGTAGVVTITSQVSPATAYFQITGYTLQTNSTTSQNLNGSISLSSNVNLNLMDSTATDNRTLNLQGNITGSSGARITIQGAQSSGSASRVNLNVAGITISTPITINGTGGGLAGIASTNSGNSISGTITNNSSATTMIGATNGNDLTLTSTAIISGTAALQFAAGASGGGTVNLNAAGIYTGDTQFNGGASGVVKLGVDNGLSTVSNVVMGFTSGNGQNFDLNGYNQTVASLTSNAGGTGVITNSGSLTSTLTINGSSTTGSFGLVISDGTGQIALTRSGTGTTTLSGTNTYSGTTTIDAGTLLINGNQSGATGAVSVNNTGTLGGTGTVGGAITVASGGTIRGGDDTTVGTLTIGNGLTLNGGSTIAIRINAAGTTDATYQGLSSTGSNNSLLSITGGTTIINSGTKFSIDGSGATFTTGQSYSYTILNGAGDQHLLSITDPSQFSTINFANASDFAFSVTGDASGHVFVNFTPVPEPSTVLGIAAAALGVGGFVRRRLKKHNADANVTTVA